ncbi:hypothetical protein IAU59_006061 [Kwoniella sp. CBS 9459]
MKLRNSKETSAARTAGIRRVEPSREGEVVRPAMRNDLASDLIFPHCDKPVAAMYANSRALPMREGPNTETSRDPSSRMIHRRLMRLLIASPSIAVYPYTVTEVRPSTTADANFQPKRTRQAPREADQLFEFPASAFLSWPKGSRKVRIGLMSTLEYHGQYCHVWVAGIADAPDGQGKIIFFFDPDPDAYWIFDRYEETKRPIASYAQCKMIKLVGESS